MAMRCANCNKGIMYGHNVSHSKRRTKRAFRPNLHAARILIGGTARRVKLCTKCLRLYRRSLAQKNGKAKQETTQTSAQASA